ncbi:hypothetical protein GSI_02831 [Ganoderma sinense ZZ0214-1]|uniref:DUF6534 domain-containing protein n=1 Tax=Ganoderma sinense ZZ0214-1 TaxID=1077348 RepID=A0A2G8SMQ0_9APHY|nr:hypothetical protein GSI_02831 [Ganoderma sinense ZZ0214-1]
MHRISVVCTRDYTDPDFSSLAFPEMRLLIGLANGLSVPCDVAITAGLSYYLNSRRTGFKRVCQAGLAIVFIAFPGHLFHLPFDLLIGKLYCNTLLATLNAQKVIRMDGENVMEANTLILNLGRVNMPTMCHRPDGLRTPSARTGDSTPTASSLKRMVGTPQL